MVFQSIADRTRWEGLVVCLWVILFDVLMVLWSLRRPVDWIKFGLIFIVIVSLPPLIYWAYRTWAAFTLEYWVDRNALTLRWANVRQIIPIPAITQIDYVTAVQVQEKSVWHWPAPYVQIGEFVEETPLYLAASRPINECVTVATEGAQFALSPMDAEGFVDALLARRAMGPAQALRMEMHRTAYRERLFGASWVGPGLISIGLLGVLVLVGVLMVNFPSLPEVLGFQYNSDGLPTAVRSKSALFLLPIMGFLTWTVNGIGGIWLSSRRESTGAYMLWGGTILVQICSLLAMISIIT